jgi:uncharacterized protein YebE (UPF0316 family)
VNYSYVELMNLLINVTALRLNIENYDVIEQIISLSAEYSLLINSFMV